MWFNFASADGLTVSGGLYYRNAGKYASPYNTAWKCEVNQITKRQDWLRDARSFAAGCRRGARHSYKAMAADAKEDKCGVDSNAIAWLGGAMVVDAKKGVTIT